MTAHSAGNHAGVPQNLFLESVKSVAQRISVVHDDDLLLVKSNAFFLNEIQLVFDDQRAQ